MASGLIRRYACPDCWGHGESACSCCGYESECEACRGTGLDASIIDVDRWIEAEESFENPSWGLMNENRTMMIGRKNERGATLLYDDFLIKAEG